MADSIFPNYLQVNPDGTVGAKFSGKIEATGLDLNAAEVTITEANEIRWLRQADSSVLADIEGWDSGDGANLLTLSATAKDANTESDARLIARDQFGNDAANVTVTQFGGNTGRASVTVEALTKSAMLLDGNGNSNFLQLPSLQVAAASWGAINLGSGQVATVNHGLPRAPAHVFATNAWADSSSTAYYTVYGLTSTTFNVINKGPTSGSCTWLAIG